MSSKGPFDFCRAMTLLCADIAARLEELSHIRMEQVAVAFAQTRRRGSHGVQAKLTPLRFENGSLVTTRGSRRWTLQRVYCGDREMLYILTFYLPRFLDLPFREKLITVFHELYHISPAFNGDIRRFSGRYHIHSHRQKEFDRAVEQFLDQYLATDPPPEIYQFLQHRFRTLQEQYGGIVGIKVPIPKLIPLDESRSA